MFYVYAIIHKSLNRFLKRNKRTFC